MEVRLAFFSPFCPPARASSPLRRSLLRASDVRSPHSLPAPRPPCCPSLPAQQGSQKLPRLLLSSRRPLALKKKVTFLPSVLRTTHHHLSKGAGDHERAEFFGVGSFSPSSPRSWRNAAAEAIKKSFSVGEAVRPRGPLGLLCRLGLGTARSAPHTRSRRMRPGRGS